MAYATSAYDVDDLELDTPEIDNDLESYQVAPEATLQQCFLTCTFERSTDLHKLCCRHKWEPASM